MYQKLRCSGRLSLHAIDTVSFRSGGERLRMKIDVSYSQVGQELFLGLLDPDLREPDAILAMTRSGISDRLVFHPVGFRVNNPRNDDPVCVEPIEPAELELGEF